MRSKVGNDFVCLQWCPHLLGTARGKRCVCVCVLHKLTKLMWITHTLRHALSASMNEWVSRTMSARVSVWVREYIKDSTFTGDDFDFCPSAATWEGSLLLGAERWEWENALLKWPHQSNNRHRHQHRHRHRHSHGHFLWLLTRTRLWILFSFSFYSSSVLSLLYLLLLS